MMIYCFDKALPFEYSKEEMEICKKNKNGILYDEVENRFTDFYGNEVDITGLTIFPRTGVMQLYPLIEEIIKKGGIPFLTAEETKKIENWPNYFKTERKMGIFKGSDLQNPEIVSNIEKEYGTNIFIKTVKKGFNAIIPVSLLKDKECVFYKALSYHKDEEFIVSEPIVLSTDKYGKKEYRCFVVNNEPFNISRFTTEIFHEIDEDVLSKLHKIIEQAKLSLPSTYVVDLLEYEKDGIKHIDVSEFNPPQAAGLYLYNSLLEASSDILHRKNKKNIAREFINIADACQTEGEVINGRASLYEIEGSFANDLRSIYLIGTPGITFVADVPFDSSCFALHKKAFSLEPFEDDCKFPMSDSDLNDNQPKQYTKKNND